MSTRWFGAINVLAIKSKLHMARSNNDWRRVLECGEDVLAQSPGDVDTHLDMANAAEKLNHIPLAEWLIREAQQEVPNNPALLQARARLHEAKKEWKAALALWEKVLTLQPDNSEARRKIDVLSVEDHIASRHHQR
jgi:tetratricopeptide (TPR) repeat protein